MEQAMELARQACRAGEVPVGAVIVFNGQIIGKGYNSVITHSDPTAHAETVALREAGRTLGNYRLPDADIYVTLEPCLMCYTALVHARIKTLFFAAADAKTGFHSSGVFQQIKNIFNHTIIQKSGIIGSASTTLLQQFFKERRGAGAVERDGLENR
ncbi:MAG: tRNA-specific adenosine deaminase [bacterium]|nr:tRNA-specific adenosine deaminase [bacterium]